MYLVCSNSISRRCIGLSDGIPYSPSRMDDCQRYRLGLLSTHNRYSSRDTQLSCLVLSHRLLGNEHRPSGIPKIRLGEISRRLVTTLLRPPSSSRRRTLGYSTYLGTNRLHGERERRCGSRASHASHVMHGARIRYVVLQLPTAVDSLLTGRMSCRLNDLYRSIERTVSIFFIFIFIQLIDICVCI